MSQYEYMLLQSAAGARTSLLNERLEAHVVEGWEPVMLSGDTTVNVLLRRPRQAAARATAAQAQAQVQQRPVAPAQPTAAPQAPVATPAPAAAGYPQPQRPPTP
jgi:nucleoid-associated protein YgaU